MRATPYLSVSICGVLAVSAAVVSGVLLSLTRTGLLPGGLPLVKLFPVACSVGGAVVYPLFRWLVRKPGPMVGWLRIGERRGLALRRVNGFNLIFGFGAFIAFTGYFVIVEGIVFNSAIPLGILFLATGLSLSLMCMYAQDGMFLWRLGDSVTAPMSAAEDTGTAWMITLRPSRLFGPRDNSCSRGGVILSAKINRGASTSLGFLPVFILLLAWFILVEPVRANPPEAHFAALGADIGILASVLIAVGIAPKCGAAEPSPERLGRALRLTCLGGAVALTVATGFLKFLPPLAAFSTVLAVFLFAEFWLFLSLMRRWRLPC